MAKYTVPLSGYASTAVDVETDETDPEKIVGLAQDAVHVGLCHQCAGNVDVGDEWEPVLSDGKPEITRWDD